MAFSPQLPQSQALVVSRNTLHNALREKLILPSEVSVAMLSADIIKSCDAIHEFILSVVFPFFFFLILWVQA